MPEGSTKIAPKVHQDVPLKENHTRNCRVLPNRTILLDHMPKQGVIAEVGVAEGEFSYDIMKRCAPKKLHLIDAWDSERFEPGLKRVEAQFFESISSGVIEINRGLSTDVLQRFDDGYFDWVYIDTDHSYETTRKELALSARKVKPGGLIAGHDFTTGNPSRALRYGVIWACNEFCVEEGWEYAFLTLETSGHFSYALRAL